MTGAAAAIALSILALIGTTIGSAQTSGIDRADANPTTTTSSEVIETIAPETIDATTTTAAPPSGLSAAEISDVQQKLLDQGFWLSKVDGKLGGTTQQAVMAFQKVHGLKRSGLIDSATQEKLRTTTRPTPASTSGDVLEVNKNRQVIFVARSGRTLWVFNTSTGTERPYVTDGIKGVAYTPTGTFKVFRSVDGVDKGDLGPLYRPRYFNGGIAVHGSASIPAYPASHGCARVNNAVMDLIWSANLMPTGSAVWVYEDPARQPMSVPQTTPTTTSTTSAPTTPSTSSTSTTDAPVTTTSAAPPTTSAAPMDSNT